MANRLGGGGGKTRIRRTRVITHGTVAFQKLPCAYEKKKEKKQRKKQQKKKKIAASCVERGRRTGRFPPPPVDGRDG